MKKTNRSVGTRWTKIIAIGVILSLVITFAGAAILAAMISSQRVDASALQAWCFVITLLSALVGGLVAGAVSGTERILAGVIVPICYLVALLAIALAFGDGISGFGSGALAVALGGGVTAILRFLGLKSGGRRHKFTRFR